MGTEEVSERLALEKFVGCPQPGFFILDREEIVA